MARPKNKRTKKRTAPVTAPVSAPAAETAAETVKSEPAAKAEPVVKTESVKTEAPKAAPAEAKAAEVKETVMEAPAKTAEPKTASKKKPAAKTEKAATPQKEKSFQSVRTSDCYNFFLIGNIKADSDRSCPVFSCYVLDVQYVTSKLLIVC